MLWNASMKYQKLQEYRKMVYMYLWPSNFSYHVLTLKGHTQIQKSIQGQLKAQNASRDHQKLILCDW